MAFLRNTFLGQVLTRDRRLGLCLVAFCVVQSGAQLATSEVTPFFLYGMYSERLHPAPEYVRVACRVDDAELTQAMMPRYAGELFFSTLYRYETLEAEGFHDLFGPFLAKRFGWLPQDVRDVLEHRLSFDPTDRPAFKAWTHRYLERVLGRPITQVRVEREVYRYVDHVPQLIRREPLFITDGPGVH
jgi:hypothetical protein